MADLLRSLLDVLVQVGELGEFDEEEAPVAVADEVGDLGWRAVGVESGKKGGESSRGTTRCERSSERRGERCEERQDEGREKGR